MIKSIYHVSFTVSSIDQSVAFYQKLGFHVQSDRRNLQLDYLRQITAYPEAILHAVLMSGYNTLLELMQYVQPQGIDLDKNNYNVGSAHIAFYVDDLQEEYHRLQQDGVRFRTPPIRVESGPSQGKSALYFYDPDGYTLEFVEE